MPLDPNIILANADPSRQYDPVASMQKAQNLKAAMLQGQVQEQALQDAKDFTRINGVTPGMAKHQQELATAQWRTQEAKSAATNEKIKAQDWLAAQQSRTYQTALDALESGAAPPEQIHNWTLGTTAQNAQQLGIDTSKSDDPKSFAVQIPNHPTESDPSVPQMAPEWDREAQKRWLQQQVKATTPEAVAEKRARLALDQQKADAENWKVEKTTDGFAMVNTKTGEWQKAPAGFRPQPTATQVNVGRYATPAGGGLESNPLYAQAKSISDMKQGLPMRQGPQAAALNSLIAQIRESEGKPPYDANQWTKVKRSNEYFTGSGKAAQTLTSNDTIYGHADEVLETLRAAKLDDTRALNTINQWISRQTGQDAKYKDLKVASKVYAMELAGMLGEKDMHGRQQIMDLFSTVDSAQSFQSAVEQSKKMAATRSAALANQYYRETGLDPVEAAILPERVAKGAVNSVAAKGYKWAEKYRTGGEGEDKAAKPATGTPDIASIGTNTRFPKAAWTKDGPDGPGWYEKHGTNVRKVE